MRWVMSDSAQPATMIDWSHCVNERDSNRYDCIRTSVVIDSAYQSEVRLINISWTLDPDQRDLHRVKFILVENLININMTFNL